MGIWNQKLDQEMLKWENQLQPHHVILDCPEEPRMAMAIHVFRIRDQETKVMEIRAMEIQVMETKVMEIKAMEIQVMDTKAMETKAMDIRAMEIRVMAGI